jgi:hypothetical protein
LRLTDMTGAITVNAYFICISAMFISRLAGRHDVARWLGRASALALIPLAYLLITAFSTGRTVLYFIQVCLALAFLLAEFLIDHVYHIEFRNVRWATISYVTVFFAASGGMIGIASQAGHWYTAFTAINFLAMAVLAFIQRKRTGL